MPSLLNQLDNESALVMFLAGELPADDHAVVERRLAADPELRAQYDELRSAYRGVKNGIASADAVERLALPEATAVRRVGQAVRAWHARRLAEPRERQLGGRLRIPAWVYAAASCAAAVIVAVGIWGLRADNQTMVLVPAKPMVNDPMVDPGQVNGPVVPPAAPVDEPLAQIRDDSDNSDSKVLADAEDELYTMSQRSPADVPSILLMGDTDER